MSKKNQYFGPGFKRIRLALGLKQKEFAALLGISNPFISELESGIKNPNIPLLARLAEEHNVNISFLLTGKGSPYNQAEAKVPSAEEEARRLHLLGSEMVKSIDEFIYHLEYSPLFRNAAMEFFRSYLYAKKEFLAKDIKIFKEEMK